MSRSTPGRAAVTAFDVTVRNLIHAGLMSPYPGHRVDYAGDWATAGKRRLTSVDLRFSFSCGLIGLVTMDGSRHDGR